MASSRNAPGRGSKAKSSEGYESLRSDYGPWIETPTSSRVSRYRYDYANRGIQVMWKNGKMAGSGPSSPTAVAGTYYGGDVGAEIDYETFRLFARRVSKGKSINNMLNGMGYRGMSVDEVDKKTAPSNERRKFMGGR